MRKIIGLSILIFWFVMMGLLIQKDLLSQWLPERSFNYARLIPPDVLLRDQWMGIYYRNNKIGYSHTIVRAEKEDRGEGYIVENSTFFALPLLGKKQFINFRTFADINNLYLLKSFRASLSSSGYSYRVMGTHLDGDRYDLIIDTGEEVHIERRIPPDLIFANILLPFKYIENLKPPASIVASVLNPLSLEAEKIVLTAVSTERIKINNMEIETVLVDITNQQKLQARAWIDNEGNVVKVKTPFSLIMIDEPVLEATTIDLDTIVDIDLYHEVAIPAVIENKSGDFISYLKVKLSGVNLDEERLKSFNQIVFKKEDSYIIEIRTKDINAKGSKTIDGLNGAFHEYTQPTTFIQSDHKEIIRQARQIVRGENNAWSAVKLLSEWVNQSIKQIPTVSVPSALDILHKRQGDCNEIVTLFAALANSLGIPAYPVLGLVYYNGAFFYHSWVNVYVGEWIAIDPTFNQLPADATHIQLSKGAISQYIDLAGMIGVIDVEVLEYK